MTEELFIASVCFRPVKCIPVIQIQFCRLNQYWLLNIWIELVSGGSEIWPKDNIMIYLISHCPEILNLHY